MNMSKELKKDWLPKLKVRYARRSREGKSRMLDELCIGFPQTSLTVGRFVATMRSVRIGDYEYDRKYAIKLLRQRGQFPMQAVAKRSGLVATVNLVGQFGLLLGPFQKLRWPEPLGRLRRTANNLPQNHVTVQVHIDAQFDNAVGS
jgi:hypothetical protein